MLPLRKFSLDSLKVRIRKPLNLSDGGLSLGAERIELRDLDNLNAGSFSIYNQ